MSRERHAGNPAPKTPEIVNELPVSRARVPWMLAEPGPAGDPLALLSQGNLGEAVTGFCLISPNYGAGFYPLC